MDWINTWVAPVVTNFVTTGILAFIAYLNRRKIKNMLFGPEDKDWQAAKRAREMGHKFTKEDWEWLNDERRMK